VAKKPRILVVDDEELVRMVMKAVLVAGGYEVVEASNGEDALKKFGEAVEPFDLVVMDMQMPRLSGQEALRQLRELDPQIKALLLSGGVPEKETEKWIALGGVKFLQKPFQNNELFDIVRRTIDS
jgi:two-component system cell cycle sensor histidine kinase/response regulator CckA